MRLWYLSHRRPAKTLASLGIQAVSPEPLLWSMEVDKGSDQKSDIYPHWMAGHAHLKNEFTETKSALISWDDQNGKQIEIRRNKKRVESQANNVFQYLNVLESVEPYVY